MGKKDEYRFNLRFDETDEMHRLVVKYLNSCDCRNVSSPDA